MLQKCGYSTIYYIIADTYSKNSLIYLFLDVTEHPNDDNENNDPSWTPTCSEDKFLCPGSSDCIWEAWLCDHEDDCPGGEDESKEVCADRPICDKNMFR